MCFRLSKFKFYVATNVFSAILIFNAAPTPLPPKNCKKKNVAHKAKKVVNACVKELRAFGFMTIKVNVLKCKSITICKEKCSRNIYLIEL